MSLLVGKNVTPLNYIIEMLFIFEAIVGSCKRLETNGLDVKNATI